VATTRPFAKKPFASSILLWMRADQPRQQGMDHWKGPHSKIISATPGMEEYRQIHLAENNPGLWPAISGVETVIPAERRIDGVAEVTFAAVLSPLRGRKQTKLAYQDGSLARRSVLQRDLNLKLVGLGQFPTGFRDCALRISDADFLHTRGIVGLQAAHEVPPQAAYYGVMGGGQRESRADSMSGDRPKHFSMIRGFHVADFFTLANAACGVAAVLCAMKYLGNPSLVYFYVAAGLAPAAL
jgi:hypothetical protein